MCYNDKDVSIENCERKKNEEKLTMHKQKCKETLFYLWFFFPISHEDRGKTLCGKM